MLTTRPTLPVDRAAQAGRWKRLRRLAGVLFLAALAVASSSLITPDLDVLSLPPIVFVSRNPVVDERGTALPGAIPGVGPRDRTARVGGKLLVRNRGGALRILIQSPTLFDVADPCVSWDGLRILFSGLAHRDSSWRIYEIHADGTGLRQVTRSDRAISLEQFGAAAVRFERYDDIDPCWLPDGRIMFASTRYPMLAEIGAYLATNLFVVGVDGAHPRRITTERSGGEEPAIDPLTGRVVYSRWWINLDRPSNQTRSGLTYLDEEALTTDVGNVWQTISIAPDGRGPKLHAGDPRTRTGLNTYKPALLPKGQVLTVFSANGSLTPAPGPTGIRLFDPGASVGRPVAGLSPEQLDAAGHAEPFSLATHHRAVDPVAVDDQHMVFGYAPPRGKFSLYMCRMDGSGLKPIVGLPYTHELDAAILEARPVPPMIPELAKPESNELPPTEDPGTFLVGGSFRFDCLNIYANAPVDAPIPDAPPVVPGARFRLFLNFQRQNPEGRDPSIMFRETKVMSNGAINEQGIPAEVPFFGHITDAAGNVVVGPTAIPAHVAGYGAGRSSGWAQCVGCHMGHSAMKIAGNYAAAEWFNVSTSARVEASSEWIPAGVDRPAGPARSVIDRRARHDSLSVAWVADQRRNEWVELRWGFPIEADRLVLYGIRPNRDDATDVSVMRCRITLLRDGLPIEHLRTGRIDPEGTTVSVPRIIIDAVRIDILKSRGRVRGKARTGLAEVETIARLAVAQPRP